MSDIQYVTELFELHARLAHTLLLNQITGWLLELRLADCRDRLARSAHRPNVPPTLPPLNDVPRRPPEGVFDARLREHRLPV